MNSHEKLSWLWFYARIADVLSNEELSLRYDLVLPFLLIILFRLGFGVSLRYKVVKLFLIGRVLVVELVLWEVCCGEENFQNTTQEILGWCEF